MMSTRLQYGTSSREKAVALGKRKRWLYAGIATVLVLGAATPYAIHKLNGAAPVQSSAAMIYSVGYTNVAQTVTAAGVVQPASTVDLAFPDATSKVIKINVAVGQSVKKGQLLAQEDDSATKAALLTAQSGVAQAEANLASAQATLKSTTQGATTSKLLSDQQAVAQAQLTLQAAEQAYQSQLAASKNNIGNQQKISVAETTLKNDQAAAADTSALNLAESQLAYDQQTLKNDQQTLATLESQNGSITQAQIAKAYQQYQYEKSLSDTWQQGQQVGANPYANALSNDQAAYTSLNSAYTSLQAAKQTVASDNLTVQKDQQAIAAAQAAMTKAKQQVVLDEENLQQVRSQVSANSGAAQQALTSSQLQIQQAQLSLQSAQMQLQQDQQPADPATVASANAGVIAAQAALQTAKDKLTAAQDAEAQTQLVAPTNGVVAQINGQVGQPPASGVTGNTGAFIQLVDTAQNAYQVQFQVSQSQVQQIKLGDPVIINASGLTGSALNGTVTQLDPTPVNTSGMTVYNAMATVVDPSKALQTGMNATVSVQTTNDPHTITIPSTAVQKVGSAVGVYVVQSTNGTTSANGSGTYVGTFKGGSLSNPQALPSDVKFVTVQLGAMQNGQVQVTSGLTPGEDILVPSAGATGALTGN
ncbi:HlyD family efflux transporter periplasmic adaptor subunit [Alicyclobacillus ferrooxydans]|uniref:CusB-like beta-barrel domain-containing protein n=1 Tax=Alicyclobacillus ferrooxydans TaxID=471514 RepID=A0A0P9GP96_9BACL|nr:HlyD family efflux transporter periplasmic adaptor subunit [Alicyclobacillus ferrooxydans]KPV42435.1 hypothetical protein AN477_17730 [Alicyclobacillus ferrooxydans]